MRENGQEPTVAVRRRILEAKRDAFRAEGYEHSVNAEVNRMLAQADGDNKESYLEIAEDEARLARLSYESAQQMEGFLEELPEGEPER